MDQTKLTLQVLWPLENKLHDLPEYTMAYSVCQLAWACPAGYSCGSSGSKVPSSAPLSALTLSALSHPCHPFPMASIAAMPSSHSPYRRCCVQGEPTALGARELCPAPLAVRGSRALLVRPRQPPSHTFVPTAPTASAAPRSAPPAQLAQPVPRAPPHQPSVRRVATPPPPGPLPALGASRGRSVL